MGQKILENFYLLCFSYSSEKYSFPSSCLIATLFATSTFVCIFNIFSSKQGN